MEQHNEKEQETKVPNTNQQGSPAPENGDDDKEKGTEIAAVQAAQSPETTEPQTPKKLAESPEEAKLAESPEEAKLAPEKTTPTPEKAESIPDDDEEEETLPKESQKFAELTPVKSDHGEESADEETVRGDEDNLQRRSTLTPRSPVHAMQVDENLTLNDATELIDLDSSTETKDGGKKRARKEEGAPTSKELEKFQSDRQYLFKTLNELERHIKNGVTEMLVKPVNTKKPIQTALNGAKKEMARMRTPRIDDFLEAAMTALREKLEAKERKKTCREETPPPQAFEEPDARSTEDASSRETPAVTLCSRCREEIQATDAQEEQQVPTPLTAQEIILAIDDGRQEEVMAKPWPEEAFRRTKMADMAQATTLLNVAVLVTEEETELKSAAFRHLVERYPELKTMEASDSCITCMVQSSMTVGGGGMSAKVVRNLMKVKTSGTTEVDLVKAVERLASRMVALKLPEVAIPRVKDIKLDTQRKLIEATLRGKDVIITLLAAARKPKMKKKKAQDQAKKPGPEGRRGRPPTTTTASTKRTRQTEGILVSQEGRSFAEVLKDVKEALKGEATKAQVEAVTETKDGKVLLQISRKKGDAEVTRKLITTKMSTAAHVLVKKPREVLKTIHVRGMDKWTVTDEVTQGILDALKLEKAESASLKVGDLRPIYQGRMQAVTIRLREDMANKLLAQGTVVIGIVKCKLQERLEIPTCFKCWEAGHEARNCKGPDRTGLCRNCMQSGHKAVDCKGEPECPLCNEKGHRAWSGQCQKFKEHLDRRQRPKNGS